MEVIELRQANRLPGAVEETLPAVDGLGLDGRGLDELGIDLGFDLVFAAFFAGCLRTLPSLPVRFFSTVSVETVEAFFCSAAFFSTALRTRPTVSLLVFSWAAIARSDFDQSANAAIRVRLSLGSRCL